MKNGKMRERAMRNEIPSKWRFKWWVPYVDSFMSIDNLDVTQVHGN